MLTPSTVTFVPFETFINEAADRFDLPDSELKEETLMRLDVSFGDASYTLVHYKKVINAIKSALDSLSLAAQSDILKWCDDNMRWCENQKVAFIDLED